MSATRTCRPSAVLLLSTLLGASGCLGSEALSGPTGILSVAVAPLNLSGITDAAYTLTVTNGAAGSGQVVWTRGLTSQRYGDGAGSLAYVGTCDAATGVNTITLTLTALHDVGASSRSRRT